MFILVGLTGSNFILISFIASFYKFVLQLTQLIQLMATTMLVVDTTMLVVDTFNQLVALVAKLHMFHQFFLRIFTLCNMIKHIILLASNSYYMSISVRPGTSSIHSNHQGLFITSCQQTFTTGVFSRLAYQLMLAHYCKIA